MKEQLAKDATMHDYFMVNAPAEPLWEFSLEYNDLPDPKGSAGALSKYAGKQRKIQWPREYANEMMKNRRP